MSYNVIAMKKVYSLIALAASVVIAAISCSKEVQAPNETIEEPSAEVSQVVPDIHFNAISNGQIDPAETKTAAVIDGNETYVKWLSTDRLIIVESATKAGSTTVNSIKTSGAPSLTAKDGHDDVVASFGATVSGSPVDGAEDYIYTAIYPSVVVAETETNLVEKSTPGTYRLNFPSAQHLQGNNLSSDSDLLISTPVHKGATRVVEDEDLEFRYKRIGTLVKLTLKNLTASETIQSVTVTAPKNIAGFINVNPAEGSYETAPYYNQSTSVTLTVDDVTSTGNDIVWFRVLPGAWKSGQTLQVVVETDKATYSRTTAKSNAIALTKNLEFVDGGLTKLAVNMGTRRDSKDTSVKYDITSSTSEIDDEATYLITSTVEGKTYAMASHSSNSYYGKVDMLSEPVAGVLSVTTEEVVTVNFIAVSGEDGKYYVKDSENNYVGCSSAKTLLFNSTFAAIKDNDSYKWEISYSAGTPTLSSSAGDLKYNSSAPRFLTYASGQKDISLYVQRGTLKADPELRFLDDLDNEVSSINLAWDDRGTFSAPTLANPHSVSVAYTSSNTAAVSVDSEGNLTINGGGKAVITASSTANATYRKGVASFQINVTGAPVAVETIVVSGTWSASLKDESGNNAKFADDGQSIWVVDDTYGHMAANNVTAATFYSPKFDMSSVEAGSITFSHTGNVTGTSYQDLGKAYYTLDDGDTWTQITLSNPAKNWSWQTATISSTIYAGKIIQFRWDFQGNASQTWEVKDFVITVPEHSITVNGKDSPLTIELDGDATKSTTLTIASNYTWSVKSTTGQPANYTYTKDSDTQITVTPAADNTSGSKNTGIGTMVLTDGVVDFSITFDQKNKESDLEITLTKDNLNISGTSYSSGAERTGEVNSISFGSVYTCAGNSVIQGQKSNMRIYNKSSLGTIKSIVVTQTTNTNPIIMYSGSSAKPSSGTVTGTTSGQVTTYDLSGLNASYFNLAAGSTGVVYISSIVITYE